MWIGIALGGAVLLLFLLIFVRRRNAKPIKAAESPMSYKPPS